MLYETSTKIIRNFQQEWDHSRSKKVLKQAGVVYDRKLLYPYCAYYAKKEMHSSDTTVLIDLT